MSRAAGQVGNALAKAAIWGGLTAVVVFAFIFFGSGHGFGPALEAGFGLGLFAAVLSLIPKG